MAKIVDPDLLVRSSTKANLGTDGNIWIDTATQQIYLAEYGDLSSDGVSLQCLYSFLKEEWKNDNTLIKYPFPMVAITPEQFEFVNNWRIAEDDNEVTKFLLRDGGYAEPYAASYTEYQSGFGPHYVIGSLHRLHLDNLNDLAQANFSASFPNIYVFQVSDVTSTTINTSTEDKFTSSSVTFNPISLPVMTFPVTAHDNTGNLHWHYEQYQ